MQSINKGENSFNKYLVNIYHVQDCLVKQGKKKKTWKRKALAVTLVVCCCSVTKLHPTLCNPMDCSLPGFPVLHHLPECSKSCPLSRWCHPTISSSVAPFSSCLQSFPASGSFPVHLLFTSGGQRWWSDRELQAKSCGQIFKVFQVAFSALRKL